MTGKILTTETPRIALSSWFIYTLASFFWCRLLLIKSIRLISFSFYSSLAFSNVSNAKTCLFCSYSLWSVTFLKKKLVLLKANAFITELPIANNIATLLIILNDAILFQDQLLPLVCLVCKQSLSKEWQANFSPQPNHLSFISIPTACVTNMV